MEGHSSASVDHVLSFPYVRYLVNNVVIKERMDFLGSSIAGLYTPFTLMK